MKLPDFEHRSFYTRRGAIARVALRFDITSVLTNVWCVRYPASGSCAYIVATSPGAIVIDAGPEASARGMMMGLQRARVGLSSLRAIVLTHSDPDQSAGVSTLSSRSGALVLCARAHARALATTGRSTAWQRLRGVPPLPPFEVDETLEAGRTIEGLEVIAGDTAAGNPIALYSRAQALLFTGASPVEAFSERARFVLPARGVPRETPV